MKFLSEISTYTISPKKKTSGVACRCDSELGLAGVGSSYESKVSATRGKAESRSAEEKNPLCSEWRVIIDEKAVS